METVLWGMSLTHVLYCNENHDIQTIYTEKIMHDLMIKNHDYIPRTSMYLDPWNSIKTHKPLSRRTLYRKYIFTYELNLYDTTFEDETIL